MVVRQYRRMYALNLQIKNDRIKKLTSHAICAGHLAIYPVEDK